MVNVILFPQQIWLLVETLMSSIMSVWLFSALLSSLICTTEQDG